MTSTATTRIDDHTLETLLNELVAGRPVIDAANKVFPAFDVDSRSLLSWFQFNRKLWDGPNRADYLSDILEALESKEAPDRPMVLMGSTTTAPRIYSVSRVRISRFGGLHEFGELDTDPSSLDIDLAPPEQMATLLYGRNGSGKSSLLSAICWCLTGWFYRPQGEPECGKDQIEYCCDGEIGAELQHPVRMRTLPIVPMPSSSALRAVSASRAPIATWVEVELVDDLGQHHGPFRRTATTQNGRLVHTLQPDFSKLGISPADLEVGTRLPAMLPYIRFNQTNGFGEAVACLIDIQPLKEVARHAEASASKFEKDLIRRHEKEIEQSRVQIEKDVKELIERLNALDLGRLAEFIDLSDDMLGDTLESLELAITTRLGQRLSEANEILGGSINFVDPAAQNAFVRDVTLATLKLDPTEVRQTVGARHWMEMAGYSDELLENVSSLVQQIFNEGLDLIELQKDQGRARRVQLYARVAGWLREGGGDIDDDCPVCGQSLELRNDEVTGTNIRRHIEDCMAHDSVAWEKTPRQWASYQSAQLAQRVPRLLLEARGGQSPLEGFAYSLLHDLQNASCFTGSLSPLLVPMGDSLREAASEFPAPPLSSNLEMPNLFGLEFVELFACLDHITANLRYVRWVRDDPARLADFEERWLGASDDAISHRESTRGKIETLASVTREAKPLSELLEHARRVRNHVLKNKKLLLDITKCRRAIVALRPLAGLRDLVEHQVSGLLAKLKARQQWWLDGIYIAARLERPEIRAPQLTPDGRLTFEATHNGTTAAAHDVSNSSLLRATLVAFWLAYWEYQLANRGGLRLMLLDDPQDLFDEENQQQLARCIPKIMAAGAQLVLATNKRQFIHDIDWKQIKCKRWEVDWRPKNPVVQLLMYRDEIDDRLSNFELTSSDPDALKLAQQARIYAESRLIALFRHERPHSLSDKPTFMDAVGNIRRQSNADTQPFASTVVKDLLKHPGCDSASDLYKLFNDAHHSRAHLVTSGRVHKHLGEIRSFLKCVDEVWDHFQLSKFLSAVEFKKRKSPAATAVNLRQQVLPTSRLPVLTAAAASRTESIAEEAGLTDEVFNWAQIGPCTVFQILSDSLGLSAPKFCRVIVALEHEGIRDSSLVIALEGENVFARRISWVPGQSDVFLLQSEALDPRRRPPVEVGRTDEMKLYPIIGVIWDTDPPRIRTRGEAIIQADFNFEGLKATFAQRVSGKSAEPLVLDKQMILLGPEIPWAELDHSIDIPVSIELEDDTQYLKVVSNVAMGPKNTIRIFNPLGGLGEPITARAELPPGLKEFSKIPQVRRIRRMHAVLYESAFT